MRTSVRLAVSTAALTLLATAVTATPASAATAAAFGYGPMTFTNSAAPVSTTAFFSASNAGEPSLGVNGKTAGTLYMAGTDVYKVNVNKATSPVGISWQDVTPLGSFANLDPILATDRQTGLTFAGGDTGPCGALFTTSNDGSTWGHSAACVGALDHPTVGSGPSAPGGGLLPVAGNGRTAYFCQQQDVDVCSSSLDGGATWSPGVPNTGCFGLFGHVKISTDGTAYVPSSNCADANNNLAVGGFFSRDNGTSWNSYGILDATEPARGFDPTITTTPDNTVYESWARAGDYHPVVTFSKDHGATWSPQVDLASTVSPPLKATTFQSATSGSDGRISVAYLGTQVETPGVLPFDSGYHGIWNLFVSTSLDGGSTWSTVQATTEPVQRGSISDGGTTSTGQRNLLDFIDAQTLVDGRVAVAYADGCLSTCNGPTGTEAQSTAAYATVAVQDTGRGLLSANDVTPVAAPSAPVLSGTTSATGNALSWTVPADGGAAITGYTVSRSVGSGAFTDVGTAAAPSYLDSNVVPGTSYHYTVRATNSAGTSPDSNVVTLLPTTVPGTPVVTASGGNSKVTLSWSAPSDGGAAITDYRVYRGSTPTTTTLLSDAGTALSYTDTTAVPGTSYAYRVAAVNANGPGPQSAAVSAFATTLPGAPVLTTVAGKGSVSLSWTTPSDGYSPITSWTILRGTSPGAEVAVQTISNGTTYVDAAVTGGTTYFYEVTANNANGSGSPSNESSVTARKGK